MKKKQEQETADSYYRPVLGKQPRMSNKACQKSYCERTEYGDERPNHKTILSTKKLRGIQLKFIAELKRDLLRNSLHAWKYGTQLQGSKTIIQPLAEAE